LKNLNLAIFGGSFDPPHIAHILIVQKALEVLDIDKIFVFPSFLNPFKKHFFATPQKRSEWMKTIFERNKNVFVDEFETIQNRPVPTIETVKYIIKKYEPKKIYLVLGADNLLSLDKWDGFNELKELVEFVIVKRGGIEIPKNYKILDLEEGVSSTKIRNKEYLDSIPEIIKPDVMETYFKESI